PGFDERYMVALVELEEGTRLVSNLVGTTPEEASIGMAVEVRFEQFDNDVVLPQFVPAGADADAAGGTAGTGADR
ncbi:MAG: OB-fold domain-containing protein, partial [Actinomycetota bacterium]|nr:OB-fold domain-containing protein [Actinomycetota bacterium]